MHDFQWHTVHFHAAPVEDVSMKDEELQALYSIPEVCVVLYLAACERKYLSSHHRRSTMELYDHMQCGLAHMWVCIMQHATVHSLSR